VEEKIGGRWGSEGSLMASPESAEVGAAGELVGRVKAEFAGEGEAANGEGMIAGGRFGGAEKEGEFEFAEAVSPGGSCDSESG
jgi:hypothetical protein